MPRGSSPKRERQYEHIKDSAEQRGESTGRAEEIAARTVNKERARSGEAKTASRTSKQDMPSSRRVEATLSQADDDQTAARLVAALRALTEHAADLPPAKPVDLPSALAARPTSSSILKPASATSRAAHQ